MIFIIPDVTHKIILPILHIRKHLDVNEDVEKPEAPYITGGNVKGFCHCRKQFAALQKLNIGISYDPAILLPGINPKDLKIGINK